MDAVREWTYAEWHAHADQWNQLLARTAQDPLFLSWEWLTTWWRVFGENTTHALCIVAAYRGDELIGLAPLYRSTTRRRGLKIRSLQFIGQSWRDPSVVSSEYLDVIALPEERDAIRAACVQYVLRDVSWSELTLARSASPEQWVGTFSACMQPRRVYSRIIEERHSYQADLSGGFDAYCRGLGQSTRRSLLHLRRRIEDTARFEYLDVSRIDEAFHDLNRLHALRWSRPAFEGKRLQFYQEMAVRFAERGELFVSRLLMNDRAISMLFDVRRGVRQYNLKMVFDPNVARSFSIGLIHFGYALQDAAAQGVKLYDFLPGRGLKTDYKEHLSQLTQTLAGVQLVRGRVMPAVYRYYDAYNRRYGGDRAETPLGDASHFGTPQ